MPETKNLRDTLITIHGGACSSCGYSRCRRALHFHHREARDKAEWSTGRASLQEVKQYPERFALLCANCHAEEHDRLDNASRLHNVCQQCGERFPSKAHLITSGREKFCSKSCHNAYMHEHETQPIDERFWRYVSKGAACWEWTGVTHGGYPGLAIQNPNGNGRYTTFSARRYSYEIHNGPIPPKRQVLDTCGNRLCVNPAHLRLRA